MNSRSWTKVKRFLSALALVAVSVIAVFPFVYMVIVSLKPRVLTYDPSVWVFSPTFENYIAIFRQRNLLHFARNSFIVVLGTTLLSLALGSLAAYGFARFSFKKSESLAFWILSLRMLPPMATVIPFFIVARLLGILDTHIVLILAYMTFNIPFSIWMMRGFFEEIPREIEEAALVDGCSHWQVFLRILLPLSAPGLTATAIFCVIQSWNEFAFALFLTGVNARTLPTTVTFFLSVTGVIWGEMAAVGVVTALPVIIFAMLVQKHMIRGLTFGAVKQ
ncbi:MAG TPA: carbohydrate ABC transporter permease [Firmicutes bacterium]|nr:carbohydrate ABC transporter permease [Bacillota bacterium]